MKLEIITPQQTLYKGRVRSVNVPGSKGAFTILHNHAAIISTLNKGQIKVMDHDNAMETINIQGGIVEVKQNNIIVLVDMV